MGRKGANPGCGMQGEGDTGRMGANPWVWAYRGRGTRVGRGKPLGVGVQGEGDMGRKGAIPGCGPTGAGGHGQDGCKPLGVGLQGEGTWAGRGQTPGCESAGAGGHGQDRCKPLGVSLQGERTWSGRGRPCLPSPKAALSRRLLLSVDPTCRSSCAAECAAAPDAHVGGPSARCRVDPNRKGGRVASHVPRPLLRFWTLSPPSPSPYGEFLR